MDTASPLPSIDGLKSVEELEGVVWAPPSLQSYVARTSFALRRKPLRDLTNEELRIGLEQQVGVEHLVPLAVERLGHDPLVEARLYPGDLLTSLLDLPSGYWLHHLDLREEAARIAATAFERGTTFPASWQEEVLPTLREAQDRFMGKLASRAWLRPHEGRAPPPQAAALPAAGSRSVAGTTKRVSAASIGRLEAQLADLPPASEDSVAQLDALRDGSRDG